MIGDLCTRRHREAEGNGYAQERLDHLLHRALLRILHRALLRIDVAAMTTLGRLTWSRPKTMSARWLSACFQHTKANGPISEWNV
jgi:hypothetical protein